MEGRQHNLAAEVLDKWITNFKKRRDTTKKHTPKR
jgi:hypothetical protein